MEALLLLRIVEGVALVASLFMKEAPKVAEASHLAINLLEGKEIENVRTNSEEN